MGIFSGINNLMDISMLDEYCDICGISKEELTEQYVKAETPFALGRPDAVIETPEYVYIMEYKIDQNPDAALAQIEERHYAASYISDLT